MSFRKLLYHPESDCLFEVKDQQEYENSFGDGHVSDVTDIEEFEELFKKEQDAKARQAQN